MVAYMFAKIKQEENKVSSAPLVVKYILYK
jgi:hypothetical protein